MKPLYRVSGNQITLLDQRYYYQDGFFCPSITTILEAYPKGPDFIKWIKENGNNADDIRDAAGVQGSNVHKMTEDYDNGLMVSLLDLTGSQTWTVREWSMFSRYVEFRNQVGDAMKILGIEMQVLDLELQEAGTIDRVVTIGDKNLLIDIKTSNNIYDSYWLQLAAYRRLFEKINPDIKISAAGILWLNAKTRGTQPKKIQGNGWQLILREDSAADLELFDCTKKLWMAQNKNIMPREISYQLSYKL